MTFTLEDIKKEDLLGPIELAGSVQHFAWGKVGSCSRIFTMLPSSSSELPLAEYWLGTHQKGAAQVVKEGRQICSLRDLVAAMPVAILGERTVERFGSELPFMLKVLSINSDHGLSIQLHPNKEQARALHARSPQHYPDANHKPEIGIALTPVNLLYGCKTVAQIREFFRAVPRIRDFIGADVVAAVERSSECDADATNVVRELFTRCLTLSDGATRASVEYLLESVPKCSALVEESAVLLRLAGRYGVGDGGLLALFLMNLITLKPGEAIFIDAGVPHAYLDGDLVECMACSDNVVRAGLTPKFKDVLTLTELIDCAPPLPGALVGVANNRGWLTFPTPTQEFRVSYLPTSSANLTIEDRDVPAIALCVGKQLSVLGHKTQREIVVSDGGAVLMPANTGSYRLASQDAAVFYATPEFPR